MEKRTKKTNKNVREAWIRLLIFIIFSLLAHIIAFIFFIVSLINIIVVIFNRKPNKNLINFAQAGFNEMVGLGKYLLFISDERPFPFNDLKSKSESN
jgi:hypothetical protein